MFYLHQHTRFTAAIVALLLTLSSSGFTAVLRSCLMAERRCCDVSMMAHMPGDDAAVPGKPALMNNMSCCAVTVAGGLNANPIVAGNQQIVLHHLDVLALLPPTTCIDAEHVLTHSLLLSFSSATSPPPVEKYVLNAAFLI